MHFISWKLSNYWLSYAIFQKCLQILWNPLQIFSTELQNSLRYSAGQGLRLSCKTQILITGAPNSAKFRGVAEGQPRFDKGGVAIVFFPAI